MFGQKVRAELVQPCYMSQTTSKAHPAYMSQTTPCLYVTNHIKSTPCLLTHRAEQVVGACWTQALLKAGQGEADQKV